METIIKLGLIALVGYGIAAMVGVVSSAPIDALLSVLSKVLVG